MSRFGVCNARFLFTRRTEGEVWGEHDHYIFPGLWVAALLNEPFRHPALLQRLDPSFWRMEWGFGKEEAFSDSSLPNATDVVWLEVQLQSHLDNPRRTSAADDAGTC